MPDLDLEGYLIREEGTGDLIGFSIMAKPQFRAEQYCREFIQNVVQRKAGFRLSNGTLILVSEDGVITFDIDSETDYPQLHAMMNSKYFATVMQPDGILTPGFKVVREEKLEAVGKYIPLKLRE